MNETCPASKLEQPTKGGSLPSRRSSTFGLETGAAPWARRARRPPAKRRRSLSDCEAEIPDSSVVSILQEAVFQRFCTERGLNQGPDLQFDGLRTTQVVPKFNERLRAARQRPRCRPQPSVNRISALLNVRPPLWKRIVDLGILACTAWIWLPLATLVLCVVKLASPGPAIYRQRRVGYRGRHFMIFKFRTMRVNAETRTHEEYLEQLMSSDSPMTKLDASDSRVVPCRALPSGNWFG